MKEFAEKHLMFNKLNKFKNNFKSLFFNPVKNDIQTLHKYQDLICIPSISYFFFFKNAIGSI